MLCGCAMCVAQFGRHYSFASEPIKICVSFGMRLFDVWESPQLAMRERKKILGACVRIYSFHRGKLKISYSVCVCVCHSLSLCVCANVNVSSYDMRARFQWNLCSTFDLIQLNVCECVGTQWKMVQNAIFVDFLWYRSYLNWRWDSIVCAHVWVCVPISDV